jgi:hypothetical protein
MDGRWRYGRWLSRGCGRRAGGGYKEDGWDVGKGIWVGGRYGRWVEMKVWKMSGRCTY